MNDPHSPHFPSSFDPAIHLHSEQPGDAFNPPTYSDDIDGLVTLLEENATRKNREGIVVQHRAWKTFDVFRSEDENPAHSTPVKQSTNVGRTIGIESQPSLVLSSSPPSLNMEPPSSPLAYPSMDAPNTSPSPRKRRKVEEPRSPLKHIDGNVRIGGFLEDDSDDDQQVDSDLVHKNSTTLVNPNVPKPYAESVPDVEIQPVKQHVDAEIITDSAYASETPSSQHIEDQIVEITEKANISLPKPLLIRTCTGRSVYIGERRRAAPASYESLIAARSTTEEGHARKSYYGIDIHRLQDEVAREDALAAEVAKTALPVSVLPSVEETDTTPHSRKKNRTLMWTEKYRARKFTDLVGDERTHRSVLRWLKNWDPIVFPGSVKPKPKADKNGDFPEEKAHRKILLLTGPPGLGKTTLAHVCARQAGYEVQEINASDERSRDVVKGRIRDMVGTENVRGTDTKTSDGKIRKAGKPVAVIVDEVDGVVGGSGGGGEGGFVKALIDLVALDQKNSNAAISDAASLAPKKKKKGDNFRILRPLILICNDVYHPSLRPLRQSSIAEIIHIRKPPLNMVVSRMHSIFQKEGVPSDTDGVRRLCEATWGLSSRKEGGTGNSTGEGDIRSVMVVGEWVAAKLRATSNQTECPRLTRKWIEDNILNDLAHGGGAARSIGRGGAKEVVERVFKEGAGFPKTATKYTPTTKQIPGVESSGIIGVAEAAKRRAIERLREMVDTTGETERIMTDCFTSYPTQPIQDDTILSKPNSAYSWLDFHDALSSQLLSSQDWELSPYLSSPILAFHHLFASSARHSYQTNSYDKNNDEEEVKLPFSGPSAPYMMSESLKANTASITALQNALSLPLARMYRSPADIATELLPYVVRMLSPDVKPVVINSSSNSAAGAKTFATASVRKASEKALVARAAECMAATGVRFEKARVETEGRGANGGWVYRMEPSLDSLSAFETFSGGDGASATRYAVRQVLEMEWKKESRRRDEEVRKARMGGDPADYEEIDLKSKDGPGRAVDMRVKGVKRDFFGRVVNTTPVVAVAVEDGDAGNAKKKAKAGRSAGAEEGRVWVSFNEGFSNAVRKPISFKELLDGL